jgi:RNA polymerase sigma factor (sigma-70 family)
MEVSSRSSGDARRDTAAILADNHRRFLAFLMRRVPTREIAEDILHDAFVRGLSKSPRAVTTESVVAWFYRVLRNAVVDHYRQTGIEERALERYAVEPDSGTPPADSEMFEVVCGCVRSLVETLRPAYAEAIRRVDFDGISPGAFARETGVSPSNARVRIHRAHRALKERVKQACAACADGGCRPCSCGDTDRVARCHHGTADTSARA